LEIALVPKRKVPGQYPGLFLFTNAARMMRPVINLAVQQIELIGTFEQIYMDICVLPEEAYPGVNIHYVFCKYTLLFLLSLYLMIKKNYSFLLVNNSSRSESDNHLQQFS